MRTEKEASQSVDGTKDPPIARTTRAYRPYLAILSNYLSAAHQLPVWEVYWNGLE